MNILAKDAQAGQFFRGKEISSIEQDGTFVWLYDDNGLLIDFMRKDTRIGVQASQLISKDYLRDVFGGVGDE
jgi:hypothetical protein